MNMAATIAILRRALCSSSLLFVVCMILRFFYVNGLGRTCFHLIFRARDFLGIEKGRMEFPKERSQPADGNELTPEQLQRSWDIGFVKNGLCTILDEGLSLRVVALKEKVWRTRQLGNETKRTLVFFGRSYRD